MRDHPIAAVVLAGLGLRALNVAFGFGWFALDDYVYVIEPAWRWLEAPQAAYPSELRSIVLVRATWVCLHAARALGLDDPAAMLRFVYLALALWSLVAIPGVYRLTRARLGEDAARLAAWLMAAQALMPLISTRALIEVVCIPPLVWGLVFAEASLRGSATRRLAAATAAATLLGLASVIRFQVGLVYLAALAWLVWRALRDRRSELCGRLAPVAGMLLGGVVALIAAGGIDLALDRAFLGTLAAYLRFNLGEPERFGTSAWYTYLLQLVLYTVPPVTLLVAKPLWQAGKRHALVAASLGLFLLVHSLIGHKEDRFLFSVLPLVFVLLGAALAALAGGGRMSRAAYAFFWVVNVVALFFVVTSDAQRNLTAPLLAIHRQGGAPTVAVVGLKNVPAYYLGSQAHLLRARRVRDLFDSVENANWRPDFILFRPAPEPDTLDHLRYSGLDCAPPKIYQGDLVDRLLVLLNPAHNKRRMATGMVACRSVLLHRD